MDYISQILPAISSIVKKAKALVDCRLSPGAKGP